jgi:hypothetical protein
MTAGIPIGKTVTPGILFGRSRLVLMTMKLPLSLLDRHNGWRSLMMKAAIHIMKTRRLVKWFGKNL